MGARMRGSSRTTWPMRIIGAHCRMEVGKFVGSKNERPVPSPGGALLNSVYVDPSLGGRIRRALMPRRQDGLAGLGATRSEFAERRTRRTTQCRLAAFLARAAIGAAQALCGKPVRGRDCRAGRQTGVSG